MVVLYESSFESSRFEFYMSEIEIFKFVEITIKLTSILNLNLAGTKLPVPVFVIKSYRYLQLPVFTATKFSICQLCPESSELPVFTATKFSI